MKILHVEIIGLNKEDIKMDNTYGCDLCGKRKDWDTEIHWITSSCGVCDECYSELSEEQIEYLEKMYE